MSLRFLLASICLSVSCIAADFSIPSFLDEKDIKEATFTCLASTPEEYSAEDQQYLDVLWKETLTFIRAYAIALTNGSLSHCYHSDKAIYDTTIKDNSMCIMDQRDMRIMVKNIYQVLANPEKAKACFSARKNVDWIYNPGHELSEQSSVAKWANRMTFDDFFDKKVTNEDVRKIGHKFTKNFFKMVTGKDIKMPPTFPYDVSANALPNLWAAAGWYPMYAEESKRNDKNFNNIRGGYAYAEVMGHWGLLRIDTINGEKVGAEVGMTVQSVDTLYPYHNHAIPEIYYNLRIPACAKEFKNFAIRENSPLLKTVDVNDTMRRVQFDAGAKNEPKMWSAGSQSINPLLYLHENTIHAFEIDGSCEAKPEEKALVSVWARSVAHDKRNDYGTTLLCESAKHPGTPAHRGEMIQCDLTHTKW